MDRITAVAMEETYLDVRSLIFYTVSRFISNHGGDFDELVSEANLVFMKVYTGQKGYAFDPDKGASFTTWFRQMLWFKLLNIRKAQMTHKVYPITEDTPEPGYEPSGFSLNEFRSRISKEANEVLDLILDTPEDLFDLISKRGGRNSRMKGCIAEYLKKDEDGIGWGPKKIKDVFEEIKKELEHEE